MTFPPAYEKGRRSHRSLIPTYAERASSSRCKKDVFSLLLKSERNLNVKNLFFYSQKKKKKTQQKKSQPKPKPKPSNFPSRTNRTRLRTNYFNNQKNNKIYRNLFLALIYMPIGKNHTGLFRGGSFSVFLLRSGFTAGFFSFFASFGFFVFVPSVAVPFFTVVAASAVTKEKEGKYTSSHCMTLQAPPS